MALPQAIDIRISMLRLAPQCFAFTSYIYMSTPYASRCYSCTSLMLLQLRKLDAAPCAECHIALQSCSTLFSGSSALRCFFCRCFHRQLIGFCCSRHAPSPLCCALVQCAVASCSAFVLSANSRLELFISTNDRKHSAGA